MGELTVNQSIGLDIAASHGFWLLALIKAIGNALLLFAMTSWVKSRFSKNEPIHWTRILTATALRTGLGLGLGLAVLSWGPPSSLTFAGMTLLARTPLWWITLSYYYRAAPTTPPVPRLKLSILATLGSLLTDIPALLGWFSQNHPFC
jgi:hypothetical protein